MQDTILTRTEELTPKLIEIRRDLHRHPELSFEEHQLVLFCAETDLVRHGEIAVLL